MLVVRKFTNLLPQSVRFGARRFIYSGKGTECPLCGHGVRHLISHGGGPAVLDERRVVGGMRRDADRCPVCHACDRTRMMMLYLDEVEKIGEKPTRILHIAPDLGLYLWMQRRANITYVASDIDPSRYSYVRNMQAADLTDLPFADGSFDVVICSHVLEHVPDDRAAMRQIGRVLADGGKALLLSPFAVDGAGTDEDATIQDADERERRFGQWDHVRIYGIDDFEARMTEAGLAVTRFQPFETHPEWAGRLSLNPLEALSVGVKSSVPLTNALGAAHDRIAS